MSMGFIIGPLIVFLVFVAPLWLILHYRSKRHIAQGLSGEEASKLQSLVERADQMQQRIITLEKILDAEAPHWRQQS
ncbi:envelope stress response membrane protein PspB [Photobacterium galatheae]|uniref:envelope stress response membrane protein PspB n=1 Tax=Photobacterium galatheae TaxID=1654360 RepID=UPI00202CD925|nr:envelope stress response membrane protein PspB [Photobacterium galatheae]MCM0147228.1 envelope stress response membrane protein PspB [Photobacterium galatheae]